MGDRVATLVDRCRTRRPAAFKPKSVAQQRLEPNSHRPPKPARRFAANLRPPQANVYEANVYGQGDFFGSQLEICADGRESVALTLGNTGGPYQSARPSQ